MVGLNLTCPGVDQSDTLEARATQCERRAFHSNETDLKGPVLEQKEALYLS